MLTLVSGVECNRLTYIRLRRSPVESRFEGVFCKINRTKNSGNGESKEVTIGSRESKLILTLSYSTTGRSVSTLLLRVTFTPPYPSAISESLVTSPGKSLGLTSRSKRNIQCLFYFQNDKIRTKVNGEQLLLLFESKTLIISPPLSVTLNSYVGRVESLDSS